MNQQTGDGPMNKSMLFCVGTSVLVVVLEVFKKQIQQEQEQLEDAKMVDVSDIVRTRHWYDFVGSNMIGREFSASYRISRSSFESLLQLVAPIYNRQRSGPKYVNDATKATLLTIYQLACGAPDRVVSHLFGEASSTCHRTRHTIVDIIIAMRDRFIYWPNSLQ